MTDQSVHPSIGITSFVTCIFHKISIVFIMGLLGSALLDRDRILFIFDTFSYGEIAFFVYLILCIFDNLINNKLILSKISIPHKSFSVYFIAFLVWTGISWAVNTLFIEGDIRDFFGVTVRLTFYYVITMFVARWVRRFGPRLIVYSFCGGIFVMFVLNYSTTALEQLAIPLAIPVTNFSGVLLPVSALYFALLYASSPGTLPLMMMLITYCSTILIYSLAAYVFMLTGLPVVGMIARNYFLSERVKTTSKAFIVIFLATAGIFITQRHEEEMEMLAQNVVRKFENLSFTEAGSQWDQSMDYRIGQFQSSMKMTLENPLFGVGELNWEAENENNRDWVRAHHTNDNPHNSLVQVISMYGIPAFIFFIAAIYHVFRDLYGIRLFRGKKWLIFVLSTAVTFLGTACVMGSFLLTYYFYIFAGIIFGISSTKREYLVA